jgi:phosphatidylserine/phosphatidylglycerophosphate/cardiolipin synthase-like enzyme
MDKHEKLRLLGGLLDPDEKKQRGAAPLHVRPIFVDPGHPSTVVMPGDASPSPSRWFNPANGEVTKGNQARYLIRGEETYASMREAMGTAHDAGLTVATGGTAAPVLAGPTAASASSALFGLMALDRLGVKSRSFLGMAGQNHAEVEFINKLPGDAETPRRAFAALDKHHSAVGCHHQKILLVNGERGLIAFVGGIDVYPDRLWANGVNGSASLGSPYEDIHCRIEGPAAFDLLQLAIDRWRYSGVPGTEDAMWAAGAKQVKTTGARCSVQIGRTHGNPAMPGPKKTAKAIILNAIEQAKRFVYVEDQYLVNLEAAAALNRAVPRIKHLTMLVPHWKLSDLPQCTYRRRKFMDKVLDGLSAEDARKVGLYSLGLNDVRFAYVHAKSWFIDDECAIIGSANCNRRGWDSDSEVIGAVVEEVDPRAVELTFAHRARMDLWARHLNLKPWQVHDGVASAVYWRQPPLGAAIAAYDTSEKDGFDLDMPRPHWERHVLKQPCHSLWDLVFDPA